MKLRVDVDGSDYTLELRRNDGGIEYALAGVVESSGVASVSPAGPGTYSVLLGDRSFAVHIVPFRDGVEVWIDGKPFHISVSDARDRPAHSAKEAPGPMFVRSQMPGKVVKLLVAPGEKVDRGQGLIVMEAMKMQNELKSPKEGTVTRILVAEGATVATGESLIVVD